MGRVFPSFDSSVFHDTSNHVFNRIFIFVRLFFSPFVARWSKSDTEEIPPFQVFKNRRIFFFLFFFRKHSFCLPTYLSSTKGIESNRIESRWNNSKTLKRVLIPPCTSVFSGIHLFAVNGLFAVHFLRHVRIMDYLRVSAGNVFLPPPSIYSITAIWRIALAENSNLPDRPLLLRAFRMPDRILYIFLPFFLFLSLLFRYREIPRIEALQVGGFFSSRFRIIIFLFFLSTR